MSRVRAVLVATVGLALTPAWAGAQDWRTVTSHRQHTGEDQLTVQVEFGIGNLVVEPAEPGTLYRAMIRYDANVFEPVHAYEGGELTLGVSGRGKFKANMHEGGRLELGLGPRVPLDLDFEMGAVEADLELGGLPIRRLAVSTGASATELRFSSPNPERLERLSIEAGAAELHVSGLGNANARQIEISGGVGEIVLDFTGAWRGDLTTHIEMGLGALTVRIPRGVGLRVDKDTFLMSFDSQELVKRGDAYYSLDWSEAEHHLTLNIDGALGSIDVRWVN